jgi:sigma-E factor negative regulatory protein RseC
VNAADAVVVRVDGDTAWVRVAGPGSACGGCSQKEGCHASAGAVDDALGQGRKTRLLRLPNTIHARPGDAVVVCAQDGAVLRSAWFAYGLPLLLALAGAALGLELTGSEGAALAGMLTGLLVGFLLLRTRSRQATRTEPILSIAFKNSLQTFR